MFRSRNLLLAGLLLAAFALPHLIPSTSATQAHAPLPGNDASHGLIYDGLELPLDGSAHGLFLVKLPAPRNSTPLYTQGPDASTLSLNATSSGAPLTLSSTAAPVACDGDGVSGNRVQIIYAHTAGQPDNYSAYLATIQRVAADADAQYQQSAAATGGTRHVRFVTDSNCYPVVINAEISGTATDNYAYTVNELENQGYMRSDRAYLVFVDANVYCGIASGQADDQPGPANKNNGGMKYARVDTGCWDGYSVAHELAHNFGAVQLSAPHTDGNYHCTDGLDEMCTYGGVNVVDTYCPTLNFLHYLDCNNDDYYNANPAPGSYLATHWNVANNSFLIGAPAFVPTNTPVPPTNTPPPTATFTPAPTNTPVPPPAPPTATNTPVPPAAGLQVNSLATGTMSKGKFTAASQFKSGSQVYVRAHVVNGSGANVSGASVSMSLLTPSQALFCTFSAKSDANGYATGSCKLSKNSPKGTWRAHVNGVTGSGLAPAGALSVTDYAFVVQ